MTLDKAIERALHIEGVMRIEEENNEQRVSAIQLNKNTQLVNSIYNLVSTLQTNQSNRKYNQKISSQGLRVSCTEVSEAQEKPEIETIIAITEAALIIDKPIATVGRNRQHSEARRESEIIRTTVVPSSQRQRWVLREKCRRCGQRNLASKECKNFSECGRQNHFKRKCSI